MSDQAAAVPHYLVAKVFEDQTTNQIKRACQRAGVGYMTVRSWIADRRAARIDLFCKVANALGFEIVAVRVQPTIEPEKSTMQRKRSIAAATSRLRLMTRGERIDVMDGGKVAGYVEDDTLFGIGKDGYATEVGTINHRAEIIGKLEHWRQQP